jgi:flagellar basal body-associated protein FliL
MSALSTEGASAATQNAATEAKSKGGGSIMPIIAVMILVPAMSYVTTEYILIPKLKAAISGTDSGHPEGTAAGDGKKGSGKKEGGKLSAEEKKETGANNYAHSMDFGDIIVNLAGAKGTRYLRTRFTLASGDEKLEVLIKANQDQLRDLAIGVLSGQTMDSLEAPGARSAIRNELISQFNHALHGELVEQLYFSEFVVQ